MADQVLLYISAATDLESEREVLGRAVTEIPIDLAWRIAQSPRRNEPSDLAAILEADVHMLLLGGDIRAPIGFEWIVARRALRRPVPFLKQGIQRTPAALNFERFLAAQAVWQPFKDISDLRLKALKVLTEHILNRASAYAMSPPEIERLQVWQSELSNSEVTEEVRGGAGESSLIFSRERYVPSNGILLQSSDESEPDQDQP